MKGDNISFRYTLKNVRIVLKYGGCALIILFLGIRPFIFDQFIIPSISMYPTLQPGDYVLVNKMIIGPRLYTKFDFTKPIAHFNSVRLRGYRKIQPNDILIFNMPYDDDHNTGINFLINRDFCKRCLGTPGDNIGCNKGIYYNNSYNGKSFGNLQNQRSLAKKNIDNIPNYIKKVFPKDTHFNWNIKDFGPLYVPRKGDLIRISPYEATLYKHIIEWEQGKKIKIDWKHNNVFIEKYNLKKYRFTHDYYFMVGDNIENSIDSRYWGFVPEEFIIGVVSRITYSKVPTTHGIKWNRLWKEI